MRKLDRQSIFVPRRLFDPLIAVCQPKCVLVPSGLVSLCVAMVLPERRMLGMSGKDWTPSQISKRSAVPKVCPYLGFS